MQSSLTKGCVLLTDTESRETWSHSASHRNAPNRQDQVYLELWTKGRQKTIFWKCPASLFLPNPLHSWLKTHQNYTVSTIPVRNPDFSFWTFCPVPSSTSAGIQPPAILLFLWFIVGDLTRFLQQYIALPTSFQTGISVSFLHLGLSVIFHFFHSDARQTLLPLMILCCWLTVTLACPLNHHLFLPSPSPPDASCADNWTALLEDCLSPVHTICRGTQQPQEERENAPYTECSLVVPSTDGSQTLAPKESSSSTRI